MINKRILSLIDTPAINIISNETLHHVNFCKDLCVFYAENIIFFFLQVFFKSVMSTFGDYKAYKKYEPAYKDWKMSRDLLDAKRQAYLKEHPEIADKEDIQRARALIRAIDVMDEYSQKRSENMEVATETIVGYGINFAVFLGAVLGGLIGRTKPVKKQLIKLVKPIEKFIQNKKSDKEVTSEDTSALVTQIASWVIGGLAGTIAAFPLMAWAAKTEVSASRKGRFDAMDKDLDNPNCFAVLTNEQPISLKNLT